MYIKSLTLKNFRNYKNAKFEFLDGINILTGDNAQGKTNAAEAIFYLCTGYSPRATRDKQVINYGEKEAEISGVAVSRYGNVSVDIKFSSKGKDIKVNGAPLNKIGELMGNINSVFFNPGELKLIQESPEDRRRFMDISISQMNRNYFYALQKYRKVLEQRNDLLKSQDKNVIYETLPFWDIELCKWAEVIILERQNFLKELSPLAEKVHNEITGGAESLTVQPEYSCEFLEGENIANTLKSALLGRLEKDIILGYTGVGPHRDDIKIKVNGEDVRVYGSQGQQRTSALSLKLAELEIFKNKFGEYPVLILDDAFSELDKKRRLNLLNYLNGVQIIITCTDVENEMLSSNVNHKIFNIENGRIV
ncbi:MAG: DNA replication/repair protein RecF [Clostridia bacterium]|nr:DNA replication/repair protein RecF [Clostridia bacterium]